MQAEARGRDYVFIVGFVLFHFAEFFFQIGTLDFYTKNEQT